MSDLPGQEDRMDKRVLFWRGWGKFRILVLMMVAGGVGWIPATCRAEAKEYVTKDGRVIQGEAVAENDVFLSIRVEADSWEDVPKGQKILVFRRDLKTEK